MSSEQLLFLEDTCGTGWILALKYENIWNAGGDMAASSRLGKGKQRSYDHDVPHTVIMRKGLITYASHHWMIAASFFVIYKPPI
jgi:hypothetical protein